MRFTRRLLDPRLSGAFVVALLLGSATASCASDRSDGFAGDDDAGAARPSPDDAGADAAVNDAPTPDAAKPDASTLPVVCTGPSCATTLVTTFGEGFCVLLKDQTVACWGNNADGQLGRGPDVDSVPSPTAARVQNLVDIVSLDHSCAIDKNGDTWCWGRGPYLRSTAATTKELTPVKLPIPAAKIIRVARSSSNAGTACALLDTVDTGVLCWGTNVNGQVTIPVTGASASTAYPPQEAGIPSGAPIRNLVLGDAVFALREDGTVFSWGANPPLARVSSLFPDPYPRPIALADVSEIDASNDNVCGIAAGAVYCWGKPKDDAYSNPGPLERALPERVVMPEPAVQVATSASRNGASNPLRGCAIGASGSLYCWGDNGTGQVGDGTRKYALSPVEIASLPSAVAQVKTTPQATCALLTSGQVYCWGDDEFGQLGGGRLRFPSLVPKEVILP